MENPLLHAASLPAFAAIRPEHIEPAVRLVLDENRHALQVLLASGASGWDGIVAPIERMQHRLARTWSPVGHLNGVANSDELRAAYNACLPLLTAYHTEMAQNAELCAAYQKIKDTQYATLNADQRKLIDNALRDFRLAGVALDPERKQRFRELMERLATAQAKFDENVLDATNAWTRAVDDEAELAGLPDAVVARARAEAAKNDRAGWLFTLDAPNYQAVLTHAEHRPLRQDFYTAWITRASEQGNAGLGQLRADRGNPRACATRRRNSRVSAILPSTRWPPRWRATRPKCWNSCVAWHACAVPPRSASSPSSKPLPAPGSRPGTSPSTPSD